jgi:AraC family transcriptional regulator of adaptative response/methylated-DNA-[protein]-cysteine methyltransferase
MKDELTGISDEEWAAVLRRDRRADGRFVYAALTTGLYCRPSCAARHPHRRNVIAFATPDEAERQGFNPCQRCAPRSSLTAAEGHIKATLDYIEQHVHQAITLNTLSQVTGLSPEHLQRTFKRDVGLSPKDFHDAIRLVRLKKLLRDGVSITDAIYRVGYGSSRALYEKAYLGLGMTPANYLHEGQGVRIFYTPLVATFGRILVARTDLGICGVFIGENEEKLLAEMRQEFRRATLSQDSSSFQRDATKAVDGCESKNDFLFDSPDIQLQVLKTRIWKALQPLCK